MSEEIKALITVYKNNNVDKATEESEKEYDGLLVPDQAKYGRNLIPLYHGMEKALYSMGETINEQEIEIGSLKDVLKSDPNKLKEAEQKRNARLINQTEKDKFKNILTVCKEAEKRRNSGFGSPVPALVYATGNKISDIKKVSLLK